MPSVSQLHSSPIYRTVLREDSEVAILLAALLTSAALGKPSSSAPHVKPRLLCRRFASGFSNVGSYIGSTGILLSA
jgi:hypothetical protein